MGNPRTADPGEIPDRPALTSNDDELLAEVQRYLESCEKVEGDNRTKAKEDLEFLAGDQWPAKQRAARERDGRPVIIVNKLPTFLHQVTNEQRLNVPGIKVHPLNDTDVEHANVFQGLVRSIEYRSNASVAYNRASNSAAAIGFGYWRIVVDYENAKSFNQEIRFKSIRNPFTVHFDPQSEEPDGSDQTRCLISTKLSREAFKRQYPKATASQEALPGERISAAWVDDMQVRIGEYYRIEYTDDTLVQLPDGSGEWASVLDGRGVDYRGAVTREGQRQKVMLYKLTAAEVLERTEVLCEWIPVFPVWGDEIDIDGKIVRSGLIRNARDPATMYNYWMTAATEEVAMRTKTPYIGAAGQFEGVEGDWETANSVSRAYLEYNPVTIDGTLAPPPQRQPMADIPSGILQMAMHANDNIKATTGLFDSSLGARGSATSGVQERAQQQQGSVANFHYADSLRNTVKQCGRCIASMVPHYYDATRIVAIMGEDETVKQASINPPEGQESDGPDLTKMQAEITVTAGPSYTTMRQEAVSSMVEAGNSYPKLWDVAGDIMVKSMDWPGASEIGDRLKRTIPPQITDDGKQDGDTVQTAKGPVPKKQAGQVIDQLTQQLEQAVQMVEKAGVHKAELQAQTQQAIADGNNRTKLAIAAHDAEQELQVAQVKQAGAMDIAELGGLIQLLIKKLDPPPALASEVSEDLASDD